MDERKSTKASEGLGELRQPPTPMYTTWPDMIRHWPKTTFCIVSNEFCERFSFYGMKTVLAFYILNVLKFSSNTSSIFFNFFSILCYVTPIFGSILADGYIGMFWTIFSVSIVYAAGQVILAVASIKNYQSSWHPVMDFVGLGVIALGTGGIKPCVAAFGGDQFDRHQERMISIYFSMFYFSINAGSTISTFITPIFRATPCLGQDSCYPLAFGIPAVLMLVATGVFMLGSYWYRKPKASENTFAEVGKIFKGAIKNRIKGGGPKREHWLDYYMQTHSCDTDPKCLILREKTGRKRCSKLGYIDDIKALFHLIVMMLPVPFFWCLYDQQSTFWLFQALDMNCEIFNGFLLLPDQIQTLNAVLILALIPIFQVAVYPVFEKLHFPLTSLRRMVGGGFIAALSFVVCGIVQLEINKTLPTFPVTGESFVSVMNLYDDGCSITVTPITDPTLDPITLLGNTSMVEVKGKPEKLFHIKSGQFDFNIAYTGSCLGNEGKNETVSYMYDSATVFYLGVGPRGVFKVFASIDKPTLGNGEFSISVALAFDKFYNGNLALCRTDAYGYDANHPCDPTANFDFYFWETDYDDHTDDRNGTVPVKGIATAGNNYTVAAYAYKPVRPGSWELFFMYNRPKDVDQLTMTKNQVQVNSTGIKFELSGQGAVNTIVATGPGEGFPDANRKHYFQSVQNNEVSILWQIPQVFVITAAEILFSVTGNEFSYSESARSMKALVQALWLLASAIGDSITVIITALDLFSDMSVTFFAYAGIMFVVMVIFTLMSIFYYEYYEDRVKRIEAEGKLYADSVNTDDTTEEERNDEYLRKMTWDATEHSVRL